MRNPAGYAFVISPDKHRIVLNNGMLCEEVRAGTHEMDTYMCGHCGRHIHLKPKESPYATC